MPTARPPARHAVRDTLGADAAAREQLLAAVLQRRFSGIKDFSPKYFAVIEAATKYQRVRSELFRRALQVRRAVGHRLLSWAKGLTAEPVGRSPGEAALPGEALDSAWKRREPGGDECSRHRPSTAHKSCLLPQALNDTGILHGYFHGCYFSLNHAAVGA